MSPTRRGVLIGVGGAVLAGAARAGGAATIRVRDGLDPFPVSPLIYGSGEIGTLDGGPPSAVLDRAAASLVRAKGVEPPHLSILEPKSSASTNSATPAERTPPARARL